MNDIVGIMSMDGGDNSAIFLNSQLIGNLHQRSIDFDRQTCVNVIVEVMQGIVVVKRVWRVVDVKSFYRESERRALVDGWIRVGERA